MNPFDVESKFMISRRNIHEKNCIAITRTFDQNHEQKYH